MAVQIIMKVKVRDQLGKGANKKLRASGFVPAIIYGNREKPLPISFNENELLKLTHGAFHEHIVFNLDIELSPQKTERIMAFVKEMQKEPITDSFLHIDFYEMNPQKPVSIEVPVEAIGEAKGVKLEGGVLEHITREVLIQSLPGQIPDSIKIDLSNLGAGEVIHVRDLKVAEGITILDDPERVVFTIIRGSKLAKAETAAVAPGVTPSSTPTAEA